MADLRLIIKINDKEVDEEMLCGLLSLEVEIDSEAAAVFSLNIPLNPGKNGHWSILDDDEIHPWTKIEISAGYDDDVQEIFQGFITHILPSFDTLLSNSHLSIRGMDITAIMDRQEKVKSWEGRRDSDIAADIFRSYQLTPVVQNTKTVHRAEVATILQRETDMRFLKRLARRNGFECYVEGKKGFFRPPDLSSKNSKPLALHSDPETNLSYFKAEVNAIRPAMAEMYQLHPLTTELWEVAVRDSQREPLGSKPAPEFKSSNGARASSNETKGVQFVRDGVAVSPDQMLSLCQALVDETSWFVEAEGEIVSSLYEAILQPRQVVAIKGLGERFSGHYYVTNVRHVFTLFQYTQKFHARRNALGVTGNEKFDYSNDLLQGVVPLAAIVAKK
ncbi:hypothetical protein KJ068_13550 [bacterium]|nr:hypothetical protein [bacterium]